LVALDKLTGGVQRSNLVIVAGRPGMGKSTFMPSVARQIAAAVNDAGVAKYGVGIISLEMDKAAIGLRVMADCAYDPQKQITYSSMNNGRISLDHQEIATNAACDVKALPIEYDFATSMTVAEIAGSARRMAAKLIKKKLALDVLMIDYLGFIRATSRYAGNRVYEIGEITAALKELARQMNLCVVLFCQLNRQVEIRAEKRPQLADLRESGNIEQDADVVIMLYREAYYAADAVETASAPAAKAEAQANLAKVEFDLELLVRKQRQGPPGTVRVFCDIGSSAIRSPRPPGI
jgi:replicative DNA helicase